jgi:transposase
LFLFPHVLSSGLGYMYEGSLGILAVAYDKYPNSRMALTLLQGWVFIRCYTEDTKMIKKTMGIDVDSRELNLCVLKDETRASAIWQEVKNKNGDFKKVLQFIKKEQVELVFMEASGGYEQGIALYLADNGVQVFIKNPNQVRHFAKGIGLRFKNDRIDAFALGRMAQVVELKPEMQTSSRQLELKKMARRRDQITEALAKEKVILKLATSEVRASIDRHIKFLEKEQETLDKLIEKRIEDDIALTKKKNIIITFKGIGTVTANKLIAYLPELGYISNKEISHLAGLAPMDDDSGNVKGKRYISGGRPHVRKALYMPAWVAVQHDPNITAAFERFIKNKKPPKVAIVAIMRKMLVRLNATYRNYLQKDQKNSDSFTIRK